MQIGKILKNIKKVYKKHTFTKLVFNSKKCSKNCIFFSIKGKKFNGNNYINEAVINGANTIVSDLKFEGYKKKFYTFTPKIQDYPCRKLQQNFIN